MVGVPEEEEEVGEGRREEGRGKEQGETGMRKKVKKVEVRKSYLQ